jgi:hypothetical protein
VPPRDRPGRGVLGNGRTRHRLRARRGRKSGPRTRQGFPATSLPSPRNCRPMAPGHWDGLQCGPGRTPAGLCRRWGCLSAAMLA